MPHIQEPPTRPHRSIDLILRICDLCIALPMLIVFAFPMLLIALMIWIEDRDIILFKQTRIGKNCNTFKIYKFRTMFTDENRSMGDENDSNLSDEDVRVKFQTTSKNDSRITKVGKFLRPTHMDELPQLLNVILGDMSLVGVRPDVPVQRADYSEQNWQSRHFLRPGITGLAQVDSTVETTQQRTTLDLTWVKKASIRLYFEILLKTVRKVIKGNSL